MRIAALAGGLIWGAAVAAVQLVRPGRWSGSPASTRTFEFLYRYAFPPGHWVQLALPGLLVARGAWTAARSGAGR